MAKGILVEALALIALSPLVFWSGWPGTAVLLVLVSGLIYRNAEKGEAPRQGSTASR